MKVEIITLIGTLGGTIVGALSAFCITWITKRFEDKKHRREVIINVALENWKTTAEIVKHIAEKSGKDASFYPLEDFIVHQAKIADVFLKKKIKPKDLEKVLKESDELRAILNVHREERKKKEF